MLCKLKLSLFFKSLNTFSIAYSQNLKIVNDPAIVVIEGTNLKVATAKIPKIGREETIVPEFRKLIRKNH